MSAEVSDGVASGGSDCVIAIDIGFQSDYESFSSPCTVIEVKSLATLFVDVPKLSIVLRSWHGEVILLRAESTQDYDAYVSNTCLRDLP